MKCAEDLGISVENLSFDYAKVIERKDKIVEKLRKSLELSLKNAGVIVINAEATPLEFVSSPQLTNKFNPPRFSLPLPGEGIITAGGETYQCSKIITATGSEPKDFPNLRFDHEFILNSDDILNMTTLPKSILIIGSGAIGVEWARIFSAFDVDVTIVELAEHLLPLADIEVSKRVERIFKAKKIKFYLSDCVEKICHSEEQGGGATSSVYLKSGITLKPEKILLAVGRKPDVFENADCCIGDACGKIQLAHFAIKQAVKEISGIEFNENLVPGVVYGCPEIAWIGKREQDLDVGTYQKSNLLISALGKSHCDNCTDGFIKILSSNGKILGAHIVSKEASSLIQQIAIAMQNDITIDDLKKVCFAHPTYSEGIFESVFNIK